MVIIPVARDELLPYLVEGKGDIKRGDLVKTVSGYGIFLDWNTKSNTVNIAHAHNGNFDLAKLKRSI